MKKNFKILLKNLEPRSLNYLTIKSHPVSDNLKKQLSLKEKLENLFKKNNNKFGNKKKITSIFIGSTTGVIVALEKNVDVFHAGTKRQGNSFVTNGGRVLAITSTAEKYQEALQQSYNQIKKLEFEKMYYRKDIGFDL